MLLLLGVDGRRRWMALRRVLSRYSGPVRYSVDVQRLVCFLVLLRIHRLELLDRPLLNLDQLQRFLRMGCRVLRAHAV